MSNNYDDEGKRKKVKKITISRTRKLKGGYVQEKKRVYIGGDVFSACSGKPGREGAELAGVQEEEFIPVTEGMKWKCLMCGWCCRQNWRIDLTWDEYDRLKTLLTIDNVMLDEASGASHPYFEIKGGNCERYDVKGHKCDIYDVKCYSCSAFPFLLYPPANLYINRRCRGVGQGDPIDINARIDDLVRSKSKAGMDISRYMVTTPNTIPDIKRKN